MLQKYNLNLGLNWMWGNVFIRRTYPHCTKYYFQYIDKGAKTVPRVKAKKKKEHTKHHDDELE